jgi:hypothetical protein
MKWSFVGILQNCFLNLFVSFHQHFSVSNRIFTFFIIIKIIFPCAVLYTCCPYILSVRAEWRADERDPQTSLYLSLTLTPLLPTTSNKLQYTLEALKLCLYETLLPTYLIVTATARMPDKYAVR